MNEWFCTVFPNDLDEMPQDFENYVEAKEYGDEMFGEGGNTMDKLKKLTEEYLKLSDKCDGTSETFAALHPLAEDLADRVKDLQLSARSREVRYLASKLYRDVSDMELRFWKHTLL